MAKKRLLKSTKFIIVDDNGEGMKFCPDLASAKKEAEKLCMNSIDSSKVYLAKLVGVATASATVKWDREIRTDV